MCPFEDCFLDPPLHARLSWTPLKLMQSCGLIQTRRIFKQTLSEFIQTMLKLSKTPIELPSTGLNFLSHIYSIRTKELPSLVYKNHSDSVETRVSYVRTNSNLVRSFIVPAPPLPKKLFLKQTCLRIQSSPLCRKVDPSKI